MIFVIALVYLLIGCFVAAIIASVRSPGIEPVSFSIALLAWPFAIAIMIAELVWKFSRFLKNLVSKKEEEAQVKINDWDSQSFINAVFFAADERDCAQQLLNEHCFVHHVMAQNGGTKEFLLNKLGKQDYTSNLSSRNWVWERKTPGKKWRAYASRRGFSFELEHDISLDDLVEIWEDFKRAIT